MAGRVGTTAAKPLIRDSIREVGFDRIEDLAKTG